MARNPTNSRQVPDHSIMDRYNKQTYLANSYSCFTNAVNLPTKDTEVPIMLLSNPSANFAPAASGQQGQNNLGLFQSMRRMSQASNIATSTAIFRLYSNPIAANPGTSLAIPNMRPGLAAALGNSSKMLAYLSPTITGNVDQVQTITAIADVSGSLNSKYFLIYSINPIGSPKLFYVWFNINSAGVDPAIANATGVQVSAATGATASTIGGDIRSALGALTADFVLTGAGAAAIVTNVNPGLAAAAADGAAATGFTFANTTPGVNNYGTLLAAIPVIYPQVDSDSLYVLDPGYSMLVTAQASADNTQVIADLSWYEL